MRSFRHHLFPSALFFSLALGLFVIVLLLFRIGLTESWLVLRLEKTARKTQVQLHASSENVAYLLDTVTGFPSDAAFRACLKDKDDMLFVFQDDSLCYWNSNTISPRYLTRRVSVGVDTICNLHVGDALVVSFAHEKYSVYVLSLLTTTYSIENQYFVNKYWPLNFMFDHEIHFNSSNPAAIPLIDAQGHQLAKFDVKMVHSVHRPFSYILLVLYCLVIISFCSFLYQVLLSFPFLKSRRLPLFIAFLFFSTLAFFVVHLVWPDNLLFKSDLYVKTEHRLFSMLSVGLFLELVILVSSNLFVASICLLKHKSKLAYPWRLTLSVLYFFATFFTIVYVIPYFILSDKSHLLLHAGDLINMDYLVIALIGMFIVTAFMFLNALFVHYSPYDHGFWLPFAVFFVLFTLSAFFVFHLYWEIWLIGIGVFVAIMMHVRFEDQGELSPMLFQLLFLAGFMTVFYDQLAIEQESQFMKAAATRLIDETDPDFEASYLDFAQAIAQDTALQEMVFSASNILDEVILGYAENLLFDSVMSKYNVALKVCAPGDEMMIEPDNFVTECGGFFQNIIATNNGRAVSDGLYSIDYNTLDPSYLGIVKIHSSDSTQFKNLYFEFSKPIVPFGYGYPKILQQENAMVPWNYSMACYRNQQLVYKYGKSVYPNYLSDMKYKENDFFNDRGMKHYCISDGGSKVLIISVERKDWIDFTAPYAVFFFTILLIYIIVFLFIGRRNKDEWVHRNSFRRRLQSAILLTLGLSFLVVGPISVVFIRSVFDQRTADFHYEQTRTIMLHMGDMVDLSIFDSEASQSKYDEILRHFTYTFFTDINLYGLDGRLLSSTRPEIFDNRLQGPLMNAEAFQNMRGDKFMYYTHLERLGKSLYQSAYISILDNNGRAVAYLNTPYFASQSDLATQIMNFILTYVNIVLFLIGVSVLLVLSVTKRLTKPLRLIQNKMRNVKIDRANEPIEWHSNDEIGQLIEQYNQLVVELEKSANTIARSERELAWREMARQVAHEIKNPLTPMRLSVQYLQKAWQQGAPDIDERMKRTTNTLIEQIDTLSDIASAYSNFAKLPENTPEWVDLSELVAGVVNLYNVNEHITFSYTFDTKHDYKLKVDKNNLSRAIGNVVKNAVQAIGQKPDGKVTVALVANRQKYVIRITDNGKGISEEERTKIFMPNFTTKSSGMGVGLSIVYNIIQASNGRITFESEVGVGTTFIIELFKNEAE